MNFNTTLPINGNVNPNIPMHLKNRTRSLIPRNSAFVAASADSDGLKNNKSGVMNKLKQMFTNNQFVSSNKIKENVNPSPNPNSNYMNTGISQSSSKSKLQTTLTTNKLQDYGISQYGPPSYNGGSNSNIEWQPVYHDTCKIKLPVNQVDTKIAVPQEAIDEWVNDQTKLSKGTLNSLSKTDVNQNLPQKNSTSNESQINCMNSSMSQNTCTNSSNKDEPYSKFKYYYNYYLVDEYLDSLAQSQNKKLDATGINEEGELYENVSLSIKPILKTKERLESGVPYDPKVLLN